MPPPGAASFEGLLSDRQVEVDREIGRELAKKSLRSGITLDTQEKKLVNERKFDFSNQGGNLGVRFKNSPFRANAAFSPNSPFLGPWGLSLNTGNAEVGIQGQGTSGEISPWGNLRFSPFEGLNFNVRGQRFPGMNFNLVSPSASYQGQFKHPLDKWTGPLHVNAQKQFGGSWKNQPNLFSIRGDF